MSTTILSQSEAKSILREAILMTKGIYPKLEECTNAKRYDSLEIGKFKFATIDEQQSVIKVGLYKKFCVGVNERAGFFAKEIKVDSHPSWLTQYGEMSAYIIATGEYTHEQHVSNLIRLFISSIEGILKDRYGNGLGK